MKIYFSPTTKCFYPSELQSAYKKSNTWPEDAFILEDSYVEEYFCKSPPPGKSLGVLDNLPHWVEAEEDSSSAVVLYAEKRWRNTELQRSDIELYKVQDSDPKAHGSVTQWREYRKALRSWPENVNFPDKNFRPKSPDNKD